MIFPTGLLVTHHCNPQGIKLFINNDSDHIFLGYSLKQLSWESSFSYIPRKSQDSERKDDKDGKSVDSTNSFHIYSAPIVCHETKQWR